MIATPLRHVVGPWRRVLAVAVGILAVIGTGIAVERSRAVLEVLGRRPPTSPGRTWSSATMRLSAKCAS